MFLLQTNIQDPSRNLRGSFFAKIVKDYKLLTVFKKNYKLDFRQGPEFNSALGFYPFEVSAVVFSLQRQETDFIAKWKHCLKIN